MVREGFLEEEKLKPAGVRVGGWRRAPAVPCKAAERSPQGQARRREVFSPEPRMPAPGDFSLSR